MPTCVVGVFTGSSCWVKTASDSTVPRAHKGAPPPLPPRPLSHSLSQIFSTVSRAHEGVTACVKVPGHPNPPAPPPAPPPPPPPPPPPKGATIATIKGAVPGDLITDLQVSGLIPEPYFENNFRNASLWNDNTWVYSTNFTLSELELTSMAAGGASKLLVFDGTLLRILYMSILYANFVCKCPCAHDAYAVRRRDQIGCARLSQWESGRCS